MSIKRFSKEYKVDTLRKHFNDLIERAKTINSSTEFPDCIVCIKITTEFPIENRSSGIHVAYTLDRKEITDEAYDAAARELRRQYNGTFGNILEQAFYPHEAIRAFLKSGSHALKLKSYTINEMKEITGHIVFGEE